MSGDSSILTVDIGSSSVRCRLYGRDLRGVACGEGSLRRYRWSGSGGAMEIDAEDLFRLVAEVVDHGVAEAARRGARIEAVAIASFWHSLLALDADGAAITPLFGWGDWRAAGSVAGLRLLLDPAEYHARTGCFLHASYPPAKLAWLRRRDPTGFATATAWGSFAEYLEGRLFGVRRCSISMASGSGLLDSAAMVWDRPTLDAVGVREDQLSTLVDLRPARGLRPEMAARWPALAEVPWMPALGDGACANVGADGVGADRPGVTIGTSAAARVVWDAADDAPIPADLWCYRLDARYRVAGGALSNGGNGLAWVMDRFAGVDLARVSRDLATGIPDAHGLTVVPSLIPERAVGWTEIPSAALLGLRPSTTPDQVAVAWLEAVAQRVAELIGRLSSHFGPATELRASGGALHRVPGWLQTVADAAGVPARLADEPEVTSRGAAMVAARELGWVAALALGTAVGGTAVTPRADHTRTHRNALDRQHRIAESVRAPMTDPPSIGLDRLDL